MIITNKLNLPQAFVEMANKEYTPKPKRYSVTALLKGTREAILEKRYYNEIEQDVSDMIWLLFGSAAHLILEQQQESDHEIKETKLAIEIGDYTVSGIFDLYNDKTKTITDYKTCSVWKVVYGDYSEWRLQLLLYAWMMKQIGFDVQRGEIVAIMKDHTKSKAKYDKNYPQLPVQKITFHFTEEDFITAEDFLTAKFAEIKECEKLPDEDLLLCTPKERYNSGDKYAVMKKGKKRALRVLDTKEEAEQWKDNSGGDYIDVREGVDKKCLDYCSACQFCSHYKKLTETV